MLTTATETAPDTFTSSTLDAPAIASRPAPENGAGGAAQVNRREPAINSMFRRMCELKASDLHLSASVAPLVRKDGEMRRLHDAAGPLSSEMVLALLREIMPSVNQAEFEARHDTDFAYEIADVARFRANVFMDRQGVGAVFRVIPSKILTAEQLELSPHILELRHLPN